MIYNFRIVSDEVDNFKREIKIDADATFLDLHSAICDAVNYDKNQLCSFFLCDDNWEKGKEICLEDMDTDSAEDVWLMEDEIISDHIEDEGQRLIFVFDYMTDRAFFMEMKELTTSRNLKEPICTCSMGNPPKQLIDFEEFERQLNKAQADTSIDDLGDIGEEWEGEEGYNEDEFDPDSYRELEFN